MSIRRFEVLQLASIIIGIIHGVADGTLVSNVVGAAEVGAAIGYVVGLAIFCALTLLVSRWRNNWARWTLLVWYVLGMAFVIWAGHAQAIFSISYPLATGVVWLMQAVALALLFTPKSTAWLRSASSQA